MDINCSNVSDMAKSMGVKIILLSIRGNDRRLLNNANLLPWTLGQQAASPFCPPCPASEHATRRGAAAATSACPSSPPASSCSSSARFSSPPTYTPPVDSATLSNLTVSNNASSSGAAVSYHLDVALSLHNPSHGESVYYDTIAATLRFRDAVLGPAASATSPSEFYQRQKSTDVVKLEFDGRGVAVTGDAARELEREVKGEGSSAVRLELDVDMRVRYVGKMFTLLRVKRRQKPRRRCALSIPVKAERRGGGFGGFLASGEQCTGKS
ncbi:hypothetical protein ACP70R_020037 [Stipagrostis hirtigluma subsp. patula]